MTKTEVSRPVLIVGAGAAGLAAACELATHGIEAVILEARDRIGGRILTIHDSGSPVPIELGAEFVHGVDPALWRVLGDAALPVVETAGEHLIRDELGLHQANSFEAIGQIFGAMSRAPEQSFASFIQALDTPEGARRSATGYVEGFNAAYKELVSVEWLNAESVASDRIEGDRAFRVLSGYDSVTRHLREGLDVRLGTPVTRIDWRPGEVIAHAGGSDLHARRAIITVPFALIRSGAFPIEPEPPSVSQARNKIATGHALRLTFRFARAVWARHQQLSFLQSDQPFPVWWTSWPVCAPVITGWAAGPRADALRGMSEQELMDTALLSLRNILGEDPGQPETWYFHDWERDPYSRGAYSYVTVNGLAAQKAMALPIGDTVFFAGEATDTSGHLGTVHGAIASGIRAARLVANV